MVACGIDFFLIPFHILDGGITGIALMINYIWGLPTGLSYMVCCAPIFALAWLYNRSLFYASIHGMWLSCLLIDLLYSKQFLFLYYIELTPLSSALSGGLLIGSGIGIILRSGASTGGVDLAVQLLKGRYPLNAGLLIAVIDILVISLGGLLFHADTFLLSAITVVAGGAATGLITMRWRLGV